MKNLILLITRNTCSIINRAECRPQWDAVIMFGNVIWENKLQPGQHSTQCGSLFIANISQDIQPLFAIYFMRFPYYGNLQEAIFCEICTTFYFQFGFFLILNLFFKKYCRPIITFFHFKVKETRRSIFMQAYTLSFCVFQHLFNREDYG